jgi:hypothetical protein
MTVRNLEFLFRPASVAVVAEPDEPSRYAEVVLANLAAGGFAGPVISVGARKRSLFGIGADVRLGRVRGRARSGDHLRGAGHGAVDHHATRRTWYTRGDRWAVAVAQDEQQPDSGGAQGHP